MNIFKALNEQGIPKFFWYTISICLISLVGGLMFMAYKSQTVNIEIASTKIQLVTSINEVEKAYDAIKREKAEMAVVITDLQKENASLTKQLKDAGRIVTTHPALIIKPNDFKFESSKELERAMMNLQETKQMMIPKK